MYCFLPALPFFVVLLHCNTLRQNPKVPRNPELVRGRKPSPSRLPLLSPPHMGGEGGHARGRYSPGANTNSTGASGRGSIIRNARRTRQRGFPRDSDILCSSRSSVERANQPRMAKCIAPPRRLLGTMMSSNEDKKGEAQPLSTIGVSDGAAEKERTTTEENVRASEKKIEGAAAAANVEEHNSSRSSGERRDLHSSISVCAMSSRPSVEFLQGSADSMISLRTPAGLARRGLGLPQDSDFVAEADGGSLAAADGQAARGVRTVEEAICESWRELPWQARLCPRAIEEREDVRRACALEKEVNRTSSCLLIGHMCIDYMK